MPGRIFQEIAKDFRQVGSIQADGGVVGHVDVESDSFGRRRSRQCRDQGPDQRRQRRRRSRATMRLRPNARSRKLAVDVAVHLFGRELDLGGNVELAFGAQPGRIGGERRERRLQPMGQVGGSSARSLQLPLLRVEQAIELLNQRADFRGYRGGQAVPVARPYFGNAAAQEIERAQPEPDLDPGRRGKHRAEQAERQQQVDGE